MRQRLMDLQPVDTVFGPFLRGDDDWLAEYLRWALFGALRVPVVPAHSVTLRGEVIDSRTEPPRRRRDWPARQRQPVAGPLERARRILRGGR
ncbi:hypothetical protein [Microbispora triticiradicis]|uniref:hypothetical protein n=1 Tax=Microbispora triticiradicis TaxID=2200763 RepID=UPI001AD7E04C|nr:hypothetical protein [Microbispora triticiradicis]MBO4271846.1 hypothetical protein [Microbispora triticiradicis]